MHRQQKTLDTFFGDLEAVPENAPKQGPSILSSENEEVTLSRNLMSEILSDENLGKALKQVVRNKGAPGIDGKTVYDLKEELPFIIEELRFSIQNGKYKPSPVKRVEIPKPDGGIRKLGIPTVRDRLVQQAISQVLSPMYDKMFSDSSYGFRPNRSAHDAIRKTQWFYSHGYKVVVDLDLSKYFDTINHDQLLQILREDIDDKNLIKLIKLFLKSGVILPDGLKTETTEGSPQGGPLSPLLSNIYLNKFDMEMERRGHKFARYADDINIYVKSKRAGMRVMESCIRFLEGKMKLKVNREKSAVGSPTKLKFLGFRVYTNRGKVGITYHDKIEKRFQDKIREITKRSRGRRFDRILSELRTFMIGWCGYYSIVTSKSKLQKLDAWIRRRLRQYLFKQWKTSQARVRNLVKLCPEGFNDDPE